MSISPEDRKLIDKLRSIGYGWGKFASSVLAQGKVSDKQRMTMEGMVIRTRKPTHYKSSGWGCAHTHWDSDNFELLDYGGEGECW